MDGVKIRIGEQARELRFTIKAVEQAEALCGGEDLWTLAVSKLGLRNLARIAAAGFSTYGNDAKRISPPQVSRWLELEPTKIPELERAVVLAVHQHLHAIGKFSAEDLRLMGEANASANAALAGTSTSAPADASASTSGDAPTT